MKSGFESKIFSTKKTLNCNGRLIDLSIPRVMGILNTTPDSFYAGSRVAEQDILNKAEVMIRDGATFIDVGGYSSRPGAVDITLEEELKRVIGAVKAISQRFPEVIISVDTFRSPIAEAAVHEGAAMVNDISAGMLDEKMVSTIVKLGVPYCMMHMRGTPQIMTQLTTYENLIKDIADYFHQRLQVVRDAGIKDIILDPGFGFAKTPEQGFQLLHHLDYFQLFELPVLVGLSRKSMIWRTLSGTPEDALNGTSVLNTLALTKGASILRVHDVKEASEVIKLTQLATKDNL